jgi:hypothetical protein
VGEGGLGGLIQVKTRLPEGTPETSFNQSDHPQRIDTGSREQPRHAAGLLQPGDPRVYCHLAWASPPYILVGFFRMGHAANCTDGKITQISKAGQFFKVSIPYP